MDSSLRKGSTRVSPPCSLYRLLLSTVAFAAIGNAFPVPARSNPSPWLLPSDKINCHVRPSILTNLNPVLHAHNLNPIDDTPDFQQSSSFNMDPDITQVLAPRDNNDRIAKNNEEEETSEEDTESSTQAGHLTSAAAAGIGIGSTVAGLLMLGLVACLLHRGRKKQMDETTNNREYSHLNHNNSTGMADRHHRQYNSNDSQDTNRAIVGGVGAHTSVSANGVTVSDHHHPRYTQRQQQQTHSPNSCDQSPSDDRTTMLTTPTTPPAVAVTTRGWRIIRGLSRGADNEGMMRGEKKSKRSRNTGQQKQKQKQKVPDSETRLSDLSNEA